MPGLVIDRCTSPDHEGWLTLRDALWPGCSPEEHLAEMAAFCAEPRRFAQFVARQGARAVGLAEASVRNDYVNGTESTPVAFLEGLYVAPSSRRKGVARALVASVEQWAQRTGCHELASDALIDNEASRAAHRALGFEQTEVVVCFRKRLA